MSIDLKQLKYFLAVAEEKSFSRAAERLHISQPPLSQQIMKLESELGVRLFARTTRTFELTVAGKALMGEASDMLAKMRMTIDRSTAAKLAACAWALSVPPCGDRFPACSSSSRPSIRA